MAAADRDFGRSVPLAYYWEEEVNIYRYQFVSACPANDIPIVYSLVIEAEKKIYVEHIMTEAALHKRGYHEDIADAMHARLGGRQILKAHHHGVDIETIRGE